MHYIFSDKSKVLRIIAVSVHPLLLPLKDKTLIEVLISGVQTILRKSDYVLRLCDLSCQPIFHFNLANLSTE